MTRPLALIVLAALCGCPGGETSAIDAAPAAALSSCPIGTGLYVMYDGTAPSDFERIVAALPNFVVLAEGLEARSDLAAPLQLAGIRALLTIDTIQSSRVIDSNIETAMKAGWDGVFFDHVNSGAHAYNANIANRVHGAGFGKLVVMNAGQAHVDGDIFDHADIVSSQEHFEDALTPTGMPPWRWLSSESGAADAVDAVARLSSYRLQGGFWYAPTPGALPDWFEDFAAQVRALDPPCGPSSTLTVQALDLDHGAKALPGLAIHVLQNQLEVAHGYTPLSLPLPDGTYVVQALDYINGAVMDVFDHWEDGSTLPVRRLDLSADTTFTAYYHTVPQVAALSVGAYDLDNNNAAIAGLPISITGAATASGVSPFMMSLPYGSYQVTAGESATHVFDHWDDAGTSSRRDVDLRNPMTLSAYYRSPSPSPTTATVTYKAVDINNPGGPDIDLYVTLQDSGGNAIANGYSIKTFTVMVGTPYIVDPTSGYTDTTAMIKYTFAQWSDGNTTKNRPFTFSGDTTLVAYYTVTPL
jgi:hypothetical protein